MSIGRCLNESRDQTILYSTTLVQVTSILTFSSGAANQIFLRYMFEILDEIWTRTFRSEFSFLINTISLATLLTNSRPLFTKDLFPQLGIHHQPTAIDVSECIRSDGGCYPLYLGEKVFEASWDWSW